MNRQNQLKVVHFFSTAWFILSAGYVLVLALRQAGKSWWVIVSLSGHSVLITFLLISLYLLAIFRGVSRGQKTKTEHPLTTSIYYLIFYDISPFLGALAGGLSAIGLSKAASYLLLVGGGSLWATFLVWIIVDPAAGLIEMMLPSSRDLRQRRLAEVKRAKQKEQSAKQRFLAQIEAEEQQERVGWDKVLGPYAQRLAALAAGDKASTEDVETAAIDIGVNAWQMGGLNCMRQLHSMGTDICKQEHRNEAASDYISIWWDGIGSWRSYWFETDNLSILGGGQSCA